MCKIYFQAYKRSLRIVLTILPSSHHHSYSPYPTFHLHSSNKSSYGQICYIICPSHKTEYWPVSRGNDPSLCLFEAVEENNKMFKVHFCQSFSRYWDWMGFSPIWTRIYVLLFQMAGPRTTSSIFGKTGVRCSLPPTSPCQEASRWPTTPTSIATWPRLLGSTPASGLTLCSPGSSPSTLSPSTSPASWSWSSPGSHSGLTIKR